MDCSYSALINSRPYSLDLSFSFFSLSCKFRTIAKTASFSLQPDLVSHATPGVTWFHQSRDHFPIDWPGPRRGDVIGAAPESMSAILFAKGILSLGSWTAFRSLMFG